MCSKVSHKQMIMSWVNPSKVDSYSNIVQNKQQAQYIDISAKIHKVKYYINIFLVCEENSIQHNKRSDVVYKTLE